MAGEIRALFTFDPHRPVAAAKGGIQPGVRQGGVARGGTKSVQGVALGRIRKVEDGRAR